MSFLSNAKEIAVKYKCSKCYQIYERESKKAWINSYCTLTDQKARLMKMQEAIEEDEPVDEEQEHYVYL